MAHRIVFNGYKAQVYTSHASKALVYYINYYSKQEIYLADAIRLYKYQVREWLSDNECRATLVEVK